MRTEMTHRADTRTDLEKAVDAVLHDLERETGEAVPMSIADIEHRELLKHIKTRLTRARKAQLRAV